MRAISEDQSSPVIQAAPELPERPDMARDMPEELGSVVAHGAARVLDFQDQSYADLYLSRVRSLTDGADMNDAGTVHALTEAARRLALWMAYEDVAWVAELKTRPERFDRIRSETMTKPGQVLKVTEYLKPRAEEVADIMPLAIGRRIMARVNSGKGLPLVGRGVKIRSNGFFGYWSLRSVASLKRIRRRSLRFAHEQAAIEIWLDILKSALPQSTVFASALAELPRLRKGYSDTLLRGIVAYDKVVRHVVEPALSDGAVPGPKAAGQLRNAIAAALADEGHKALDAFLSGGAEPEHEAPTLEFAGKDAHAH